MTNRTHRVLSTSIIKLPLGVDEGSITEFPWFPDPVRLQSFMENGEMPDTIVVRQKDQEFKVSLSYISSLQPGAT